MRNERLGVSWLQFGGQKATSVRSQHHNTFTIHVIELVIEGHGGTGGQTAFVGAVVMHIGVGT